MKKAIAIFLIAFSFTLFAYAQKSTVLDSLILPELIDSLFIDRDVNNWSVRLFTSFKNHRFTLQNSSKAYHYVPNNPFGIGVGFATRKVLLDLGMNIKGNQQDTTNRLDIQANLMLNKHLFDFSLQRYTGFNILDDTRNSVGFRRDIISFALALEYLYLFNANNHSIDVVKAGPSIEKKITTSFGLGGFVIIRNQLADSSIIPSESDGNFNEYAKIVKLKGIGAGLKGSFVAIFPLPNYFFTSLSVSPGIGLMLNDVEAESISYRPTNPLLYKLDLGAGIGYNGNRIYITLRLALGFFKTDLDFGNKASYNTGHAKLAIGYKLGKH